MESPAREAYRMRCKHYGVDGVCWKKWAKRYGTRPGKMIYLPNVEVESEYNGDYMNVNVTAKPTKQE